MKKKKKMLLGATLALTAALALGAGTLGASASVSGFNDFIKEDFNSGSLNGDVWQTPAEGIELINVEPSLTYRIYHQKSVSTKEEVIHFLRAVGIDHDPRGALRTARRVRI